MLQPNTTLIIHLTATSFNSQHGIFWSESADPATYPNTYGSKCVGDPDTEIESLTNGGPSARKGGLW